jgi:hypothetical protein
LPGKSPIEILSKAWSSALPLKERWRCHVITPLMIDAGVNLEKGIWLSISCLPVKSPGGSRGFNG